MTINLTNTFSLLNNPSALGLFIVKDAADVTGRVGMAYYEGYKGKTQESLESGRHEARERFIDELGASLAWLGGVPLFRKIYDETIFKHGFKLDPSIHLKKILKEKGCVQAFKETDVDPLFKTKKILEYAKDYKTAHIGKVLFSTVIPCLTIAFALPRLNKWLTSSITDKELERKALNAKKLNSVKLSNNAEVTFSAFYNKAENKDQIKFKGGLFDIPGKIIKLAQDAQLSPVNSMLAIDLGISGGRVLNYDRKPQERYETAFKEAGIIFFFFVASDLIRKGIEGLAGNKNLKDAFKKDWMKNLIPAVKLPNIPIYLDPKVMEDDTFKTLVENVKKPDGIIAHMDEFAKHMDSEEKLVNFINKISDDKGKIYFDKETGKFTNYVLEAAKKSGIIPVEKDKASGKYFINKFKFIETEQVIEVHKNIEKFVNRILNKEAAVQDIGKFVNKAKNVKRAGIIVNLLICNAFLGYILPKLQYLFREKRTGTNLFPAVQDHLEAKSLSR
jgi:hypothetical protein